jgi:iron-sulfur cluster assembly protein
VSEASTQPAVINYKIGNERLIKVTENASRKLNSLLQKQGRATGALRVAVIGGGCSGLQYKMDLVDGPANRTSGAIFVRVGRPEHAFVSGSLLDYSDDLQKGGFKVTNPNAVAHCSCGEFRCMIDYFALLDQPRALARPNELKHAHQKTLQTHRTLNGRSRADAADTTFASLNEAYQVLQDPKRRLRHLLSLEGAAPSSHQTVPQHLHDLFPVVGTLTQRANLLLEKIGTTSNRLSQSLLKPQILEAQNEVKAVRTKIQHLFDTALAELCQINPAGENPENRQGLSLCSLI